MTFAARDLAAMGGMRIGLCRRHRGEIFIASAMAGQTCGHWADLPGWALTMAFRAGHARVDMLVDEEAMPCARRRGLSDRRAEQKGLQHAGGRAEAKVHEESMPPQSRRDQSSRQLLGT